MKFRPFALTLAAVGALSACGGGSDSTAPATGLTKTDLNELANSVDAMATQALMAMGLSTLSPSFSVSALDVGQSFSAIAVNRTFSGTHACPSGGSVSVAGSAVGSADQTSRNLSLTVSATRTDAACGLSTSRGVVTITSTPSVAMTAIVNVVGGVPVGPQTVTNSGSFSWNRGTDSGSCAVNVTSVYTPSAGMITVSGTVCGTAVSYSHTAPKLI
ncbi:MAG: hypothetical protein M3Z17_07310 [Gemmatimonadota bacterium]|nr:hypothetical protein [Gemmatimonadota bacterium]